MERHGTRLVTLELPVSWIEKLEALVEPEPGLYSIVQVLQELADHAQRGVYRPGSWERPWLCQAFGENWLLHMEWDEAGLFQRPALEGPTTTSEVR